MLLAPERMLSSVSPHQPSCDGVGHYGFAINAANYDTEVADATRSSVRRPVELRVVYSMPDRRDRARLSVLQAEIRRTHKHRDRRLCRSVAAAPAGDDRGVIKRLPGIF